MEEALTQSLNSKATAITDLSEDFIAERAGNWIKIIHIHHDREFARYYGFNRIEDVKSEFLRMGWEPVSAGTPLQHLANV